jgi:hypothetical protein
MHAVRCEVCSVVLSVRQFVYMCSVTSTSNCVKRYGAVSLCHYDRHWQHQYRAWNITKVPLLLTPQQEFKVPRTVLCPSITAGVCILTTLIAIP